MIKIFQRLFFGLIGCVVLALFSLIAFLDIRFNSEGLHIAALKWEPLCHFENIQIRYSKDFLFISIETAYVKKGVFETPSKERLFPKIGLSIKHGVFKGEGGAENVAFSLECLPWQPVHLIVEQKLSVTIYPEGTVALAFDKVPIGELKGWVRNFYDHPTFDWIGQGTLDGAMHLDIEAHKLLEGELFLENIQGGDIQSGCFIFVEKIAVRPDQNIEVVNGSVRIAEPKEGYDFGVENLSGNLKWGFDHGIHFDLEGLLRQGVDTYPIFLQGSRGQHTILEADASLLLDQGANLKRYFHISLENPVEGTVILKGLFDHVVESELHALRQLFKADISFFDPIHVASMQVSFEVQGIWENGHLISITAEDILGEFQVSFYDQPILPLKVEARYSEAGLFSGKIKDGVSNGILEVSFKGGLGSFRGDDLSAPLLNSLLTPFRDGWNLRGSASVFGDISEEGTKVHFSSSDLTFIDSNVEFCLTKKPLEGDFLITPDDNVHGLLDCKEGELQISGLTPLPLIFDQLHSRISIWNEEVYLDEIQTTFQDLQLEGKLALQPLSTGGMRLKVAVHQGGGPLKGLQEWIHPFDQFIEGALELQGEGFSLEADLIQGGDCNYQIDFKLKEGVLGTKQNPYSTIEAEIFHSSWLNKSRFDVSLMGEAIDWIRVAGSIDQGFFCFDSKKTHLFQNPFKQLQGGEKEGGIAFSLSQEELDSIYKIFQIKNSKQFSSVECFVGFRNFSDLIAGTCKLDQQEVSFIKEQDHLTIKKGNLALFESVIEFDDLELDLNSWTLSNGSIFFSKNGMLFKGHFHQGNLTIEEIVFNGQKIQSTDPIKIGFEGVNFKLQGGTLLIGEKHKVFLSSLLFDPIAQAFSLKTSKLEIATEEFIEEKRVLTGWVKGEWSDTQKFLDYKMTPFSFSLLDQSIHIHNMSGILQQSRFKVDVEGKVNQLQFKSDLKSDWQNFNTIRWNVESDLGNASIEAQKDPNIGWILHESKGDIVGLIWSLSPHGNLKDREKFSVIGSITVDPSLFVQGLNTYKIPLHIPYQIEKPLQLNGVATFFRNQGKAPIFDGDLLGKYLKIEGVGCRNLSTHLHLEEGTLEATHIHASDPAFDLSIDTAKMHLDTQDLLVEGITLIDCKPALLTKSTPVSKNEDPFIVKELVIPSLFVQTKGGIQLKGKGELYFINQEARSKNILDLPRDILAVIGLDPSLLVPICGHIEFTLEKDKILLDRLRRSYSDEFRSSFFLDPKNLSYITLDGGLFIRMRMKQSAILRLAEPFIIAIDGSLTEPSVQLK
ncbi:MAG: hypothetical protein ACOYK9_01545 [Chlamydiia bacterium]